MRGIKTVAIFLASIIGTLSIPLVSSAAPDLIVYPTRIVMTDRQRSAQVDMVNTSQLQEIYKLSLVRKRMTLGGEFVDVSSPQPEERFADDLVKFSPRQVTLVPGAGQTIRMILKLPPNLPEGEYRSHLLVMKPPAAITELPKNEDAGANTLSMQITANMGISIPVIVRHGNLEAKAEIEPSSVHTLSDTSLAFKITRTGTRSIYGDVTVFRGADKLAEAKGLAVYTPNSQREVTVRLQNSRISAGDKVRIVFTEKDEPKPVAADTTVIIP